MKRLLCMRASPGAPGGEDSSSSRPTAPVLGSQQVSDQLGSQLNNNAAAACDKVATAMVKESVKAGLENGYTKGTKGFDAIENAHFIEWGLSKGPRTEDEIRRWINGMNSEQRQKYVRSPDIGSGEHFDIMAKHFNPAPHYAKVNGNDELKTSFQRYGAEQNVGSTFARSQKTKLADWRGGADSCVYVKCSQKGKQKGEGCNFKLKFELTTDGKLVPFAISSHKDPTAEFNNTMHNHDIALTRVHRRALPQLRIIPDSIQDTLLTMIHGGIREIRQLHRIAVRHFYAFEKEKNDEVDASSLDATSSSCQMPLHLKRPLYKLKLQIFFLSIDRR
jgi:hypothetical protein